MEIIDAARDNLDLDKMEKEAGIVDDGASSDSDSSEDDEEAEEDDSNSQLPDDSTDDKQNLVDRVKDFNKKEKALHRQHRGMMQFKVSGNIILEIVRSLTV